ncbi:MAG: hypothetical protein R6U37_00985 [Dehalococcoidia bacterium]
MPGTTDTSRDGKWVVAVLALAAMLLICGACQESDDSSVITPAQTGISTVTPADSSRLPARGYFKGFASLLPPDGDFEAIYQEASENAEFVNIWPGAADSGYWNLGSYLEGEWGANFVDKLCRGNGMFPVINLSFIDRDPQTGVLVLKTPEGESYSELSDPAFRSAYKEGALEAIPASRPLYLSLGNEVNRWYEQYGAEPGDPNGFQHFVSLYEEIYDAVKEISPRTEVFCIFAREIVDENREADLAAMDLFDPDKMDVLALTSYPFAVRGINRVSDIPDDYYSRVLDHFNSPGKPFGFTELGWSTLEAFGTEEGQAEFLEDAAGRLTIEQDLNLHLLGWFSLCDLEMDPHKTGLISASGKARKAYEIWRSL